MMATTQGCGASFSCFLDGDQVVWQVDQQQSRQILQLTLNVAVDSGVEVGTAIVNDNGALVGILRDGSRLLLTPLGEPRRIPGGSLPTVTIPEGYTIYETDQHSQ